VALSVEGKSTDPLSGRALQQAIEKLWTARKEIATTIRGLRDFTTSGAQFDSIAPLDPGSAQQKGKEISEHDTDDNFLDLFQL